MSIQKIDWWKSLPILSGALWKRLAGAKQKTPQSLAGSVFYRCSHQIQ
jgi:hypothetical protein